MAKHSRKSIFVIVLMLCAALCLGIFAACGDDDNNTTTDQPVTYTVTVMKDATTPAEGVRVTVKKGTAAFAPKTTGADGKVTFELVPDDYEVTLSNIPAHYVAPEGTLALTKSNQNVTFMLQAKPVYTVKLVNPDGSPYYADGVMVGVCDNESCRTPVALDEQGVAKIEEAKGEYHVQIQGLPKDRAYKWISSAAANYYSEEEFKDEVTEMTIVIYPVKPIETVTPMTDDEKTAYAESNWSASFKSGSTAYKVNVTIPAGESAYYSITPSRSGKYNCYFERKEGLNYLYYGTNFANNGDMIPAPVLEANKTYYISFNNNTANALQVEFVIETPVASYHEVTSAQTVSARVDNADAYAVIELKPTEAGAYKATAQGKQTAIKTVINSDYASFDSEEYAENSSCTIRFTTDMLGRSVYIVVSVKPEDNNYPASLTVKIEKTNDLKDTTTVVEVKETLKKFGDQAGMELVPVALDGSDTIYYDEENGYYRLGDEENPNDDDPIVVVMLTKNLDPDRFCLDNARTLVYLEMQTSGSVAPYVFDVTEDKTSLEKGNEFIDYRAMLRGFAEYDKTPNNQGGYTLSIPEDMDVDEYYAKYVNSDGVYPLTKELEEYLKRFAEYAELYAINNRQDLIPYGEENWMFACYYYVPEIEPDIIVGEYKFVRSIEWGEELKVGDRIACDWDYEGNPILFNEIGDDEFKLVIQKRYKFTIYKNDGDGNYEEYLTGTWSKEGENYIFQDTYGVTYTIAFNYSAGTIKLEGDDAIEEEDENGEIVVITPPTTFEFAIKNKNNG